MNVVYPGSFDPPTNGHIDIYRRASRLFDRVTIAVLQNAQKQSLFSLEERIGLLSKLLPQAAIKHFDGLLVHLAPDVVIRGLRNATDYEIELQMATLNRHMLPSLDTVFLLAAPMNAVISSRIVKEIASLGGDVPALVPALVVERLKLKFPPR